VESDSGEVGARVRGGVMGGLEDESYEETVVKTMVVE
jgi:hypothetical protein